MCRLCWNLRVSISRNPDGPYRPVRGFLYHWSFAMWTMDYGTQVLRFRGSILVLSPAVEYKSTKSGPHSSTANTDGDSFLSHKWAKLTDFPDETRMIPETSHASAALTPGKGPAPIVHEAGWAPGPVWTGAENLASTGIRFPDCPTHSETLRSLSYPGPVWN